MIKFRAARGLAFSVSAVALAVTTSAFAQDTENRAGQPTGVATNDTEEQPEQADISNTDAEGNVDEGAIVVTGSRIQRTTTYSSISPLQVLETETLQDTGQFQAAQILQQSESAAGTQIDATFSGFVLNNGPNSQTLDLRGLGADRTLLLINGRRMAPAGVEGAPTSPSINLLPSSLIARYDLLLDGASSVYGSDAVAGVGNIILRKDIDRLELFASGTLPTHGGDSDYTASLAWGKKGSNWSFGIGAEYNHRGEILLQDKPWLAGCDRHYEETSTGEIRNVDLGTNAQVQEDSGGTISTSEGECKIGLLAGRIFLNGTYFGSVYGDTTTYPSTGKAGNSGVPGFSESTDAFGLPVDRNGDGIRDVDFQKVNLNGREQDITFVSPEDLYNVMAYGEYTFDGDMNITPFFEANYSRSDVKVANSGTPQLFPFVRGTNQFNPCNISLSGGVRINPNGVDCRAVNNVFEGFVPGGGFPASYALGTGTSVAVQPIVAVRGDRNNVKTRLEQYRGVLGVRGDLPFINISGDNDWTFEIAGVYSHSRGTSVRNGIREDKLAFALGLDPTGDYTGDGVVDNNGDGIADDYNTNQSAPPSITTPCNAAGLRNPNLAAPDLIAGCVPVNLFAASLFPGGPVGDFASQAERDYLFGARTFLTKYDQTDISAFVQGSVFNLPGGPAKVVLGGEYRKDKLNSQPDFVASNGLAYGFFADQGAQGSKEIWEAFGEIDLPLITGQTMAQELRLNLSGRATHDQYYGWNETYSVKLGWRPVEQLLLKMAAGTSFRAPNLRENFLAGQSGFNTIIDPCAVPADAYTGPTDTYDPSKDKRAGYIIANCIREGRDPTRVGIQPKLNSNNAASAEITSGGSLLLDPETSKSFTTGFAFQERFGPVNFNFNFNYYNIRVSGAIAEPTGQYIVNQCFNDQDGVRSSYCDFISYDQDPTGRQLVEKVFAGFININKETVKGIDLNANFDTDVRLFGEDVGLGLNLRANHLITRNTELLNDDGSPDLSKDAGTFGFPHWTGRATFTAKVKRLTATWQTRWIGKVSEKEDQIDPFADYFGNGPDGNPVDVDGDGSADFFGDTCTGGGSPSGVVAGDGVFCRDIGWAGNYFIHSASLRYTTDRWEARVGVSNIFDKAPPRVDSDEVFSVANTPIGTGYDLNGRQFFGSVQLKF
ncbi:TonB-dependent receptor domain-containing protein [Tsuneonella rigui]|uniref:TonB-dependent receptor domain-containing protein n=1 Tax=Tsuneonella rigui TaxID=1708790 RepID=UPI000F7DE933|nr:TonB-dependent receptor [Tsuneonella rigui]